MLVRARTCGHTCISMKVRKFFISRSLVAIDVFEMHVKLEGSTTSSSTR